MTWSIIARDPASGLVGVAIASRFFAVGALCVGTEAGVGAVCTQALMNPVYAGRGLGLLREGLRPADICPRLVAGDGGADQRQVHVMNWQGDSAAHTGAQCVDWCGHLRASNVSVAGNMLAGRAVIADTLEAFRVSEGPDLVERLLAAMEAGEAAGGDKRGKQSAALIIQGDEIVPALLHPRRRPPRPARRAAPALRRGQGALHPLFRGLPDTGTSRRHRRPGRSRDDHRARRGQAPARLEGRVRRPSDQPGKPLCMSQRFTTRPEIRGTFGAVASRPTGSAPPSGWASSSAAATPSTPRRRPPSPCRSSSRTSTAPAAMRRSSPTSTAPRRRSSSAGKASRRRARPSRHTGTRG